MLSWLGVASELARTYDLEPGHGQPVDVWRVAGASFCPRSGCQIWAGEGEWEWECAGVVVGGWICKCFCADVPRALCVLFGSRACSLPAAKDQIIGSSLGLGCGFER